MVNQGIAEVIRNGGDVANYLDDIAYQKIPDQDGKDRSASRKRFARGLLYLWQHWHWDFTIDSPELKLFAADFESSSWANVDRLGPTANRNNGPVEFQQKLYHLMKKKLKSKRRHPQSSNSGQYLSAKDIDNMMDKIEALAKRYNSRDNTPDAKFQQGSTPLGNGRSTNDDDDDDDDDDDEQIIPRSSRKSIVLSSSDDSGPRTFKTPASKPDKSGDNTRSNSKLKGLDSSPSNSWSENGSLFAPISSSATESRKRDRSSGSEMQISDGSDINLSRTKATSNTHKRHKQMVQADYENGLPEESQAQQNSTFNGRLPDLPDINQLSEVSRGVGALVERVELQFRERATALKKWEEDLKTRKDEMFRELDVQKDDLARKEFDFDRKQAQQKVDLGVAQLKFDQEKLAFIAEKERFRAERQDRLVKERSTTSKSPALAPNHVRQINRDTNQDQRVQQQGNPFNAPVMPPDYVRQTIEEAYQDQGVKQQSTPFNTPVMPPDHVRQIDRDTNQDQHPKERSMASSPLTMAPANIHQIKEENNSVSINASVDTTSSEQLAATSGLHSRPTSSSSFDDIINQKPKPHAAVAPMRMGSSRPPSASPQGATRGRHTAYRGKRPPFAVSDYLPKLNHDAATGDTIHVASVDDKLGNPFDKLIPRSTAP